MAYAYSQIDNLLKGGNPTPGNANVFQLGQDPNQGQTPFGNLGQGQTPGGMTGNGSPANPNGVKSDVSGDLSNVISNGSGSSGGQQAGGALSGDQQAAGKALAANRGKVATPGAFGTIGQNLSAANSGLQQQASDYLTSQKANNAQPLDISVLQNAIGGNTNATMQTSDLLSKSAPTSAAAFNPTGLSVPNADLLATNAGIQQIVGQGQSPTYTNGMGAFDTMLLGGDKGFVSQLNSLKSGYRGLQDKTKADLTSLPTAALADQQNALAGAQGKAKDYLGYQSGLLTNSATQKAAAANAELAKLQDPAAKAALQQQQLQAQEQQVTNALNALFGNGRANDQYQAAIKGIDPSKYINYATQFSPQQFYTPDQAMQYNQINSLLRLNTPQVTGSASAPTPYTVDTKGLYNAIYDPSASARYAKDLQDQQQIDAINAVNKESAATYQNLLNQLPGKISANAYNSILQNPNLSSTPNWAVNPFNPSASDQTIPNVNTFTNNWLKTQGIDTSHQYTANDLMTQQNADLMNSLFKDLGQNTTVSAGKYPGTNPGVYDKTAYNNAILAAVKAAAGSQMTPADNQGNAVNPNVLQPGDVLGQMPNVNTQGGPNNVNIGPNNLNNQGLTATRTPDGRIIYAPSHPVIQPQQYEDPLLATQQPYVGGANPNAGAPAVSPSRVDNTHAPSAPGSFW